MRCPACKSELIVGGQKHLETSEEHVMCIEPSLKDFYVCSNTNCDCNKLHVVWDQWGDYYSGSNWKQAKDIKFIGNNYGAFDSFARQLQVEIYKDDENFYFPSIFGWQIQVKYIYKSNECGDILSKRPSLVFWHNHCWRKSIAL